MQRGSWTVSSPAVSVSFNPHPARRPDATLPNTCAESRSCGFNPHPARRPDATVASGDDITGLSVSILIRPEGRMQHHVVGPAVADVVQVSILIRPEGRMQRPGRFQQRYRPQQVSILIRPEGRMQQEQTPQASAALGQVSILIRPEGRMQRGCDGSTSWLWRFQSSSGQKAGCNAREQGRLL